MSYALEWDEKRRLHVYCHGQRLALVPEAQAKEVWTIATELAREKRWRLLAAFCAGVVYGTGEIGVPDVVETAMERPGLTAAPVALPKVPKEGAAPAEGGSVIRFPGAKHDHD